MEEFIDEFDSSGGDFDIFEDEGDFCSQSPHEWEKSIPISPPSFCRDPDDLTSPSENDIAEFQSLPFDIGDNDNGDPFFDEDNMLPPMPLLWDDYNTVESNVGFDIRSEEESVIEEEPQRNLMLPEMPPSRAVDFLEIPDGSSVFVPSPLESSTFFGCSGICEKIDNLSIFQGTNFVETVNLNFLSVALGCDEGLFQPHEVSACSTARNFIGLLTNRVYENERSEIKEYQREQSLLFGMEELKTGSNVRGPKLDIVMKIGKKKPRYLKPLLARKNAKMGWFLCKLHKAFLLLKNRTEEQQRQEDIITTTKIIGKKRKKKKKKKKKMKFTDFKALMVLYLEAFVGLLTEFPNLHTNLKKNINEELINSLKIFKSKHFKNPQMTGCLLNYLFCHGFQKSGRFFHTYRRNIQVEIEEDNGFNIDVFREYVENYEDLAHIRHLCEKFVWREEQKNIFKLVKIAAAFFIIKAKDYERVDREIRKILEEKLLLIGKKRKKRSSSNEDFGDNNNSINSDVQGRRKRRKF